MGTFFIRYSCEFVITVIVITEFDFMKYFNFSLWQIGTSEIQLQSWNLFLLCLQSISFRQILITSFFFATSNKRIPFDFFQDIHSEAFLSFLLSFFPFFLSFFLSFIQRKKFFEKMKLSIQGQLNYFVRQVTF